jgi:hypothetical protein
MFGCAAITISPCRLAPTAAHHAEMPNKPCSARLSYASETDLGAVLCAARLLKERGFRSEVTHRTSEVAMPPHEEQFPPPSGKWDLNLIALGVVVLAFIGALLLTNAWPPGM